MNNNKKQMIIVIGTLLIVVGVFLFVVLVDFDPEDSLYFSNQVKEQKEHFLGKYGTKISSLMFIFLGRGSFVASLAMIYSGITLIRKISTIKKIILILVVFGFMVTFTILLSYFITEPVYAGGGIAGTELLKILSVTFNNKVLILLLFSAAGGKIFILLSRPLKTFFAFLKSKNLYIKGFIKKSGVHSFKKRKKPPLIEKVYYDEKGIPIKIDQVTPGYKEEQEHIPVEDGKGQYLIEGLMDSKSSSFYSKGSQKVYPSTAAPDKSLLRKSSPPDRREREKETTRKARELERTLNEFGIEGRVTGIIRGPVITRYELQPAPGVKLSRIVNLSDNIALSLSANGVRIEAPIPGRSAVGIEIPNEERETVTLGDIIEEASIHGELPLILGRDISGKVVCADLTIMPHLLIAGATGSGKSVCVNSLIVSLLFHKKPEQVRFLMIDPKMVELKIYNGIPHLLTEVITDPRDVSKALRWVIYEMENRYCLLDEHQVRDIKGYNHKAREKMPYIVVIIDEFANLMAISQKEVEDAVVRLAAMCRAVGIHLIMATQRPSVDVITGLIKANFPYRIAFQVASKTDSRTIMDTIGAEKLLGRGDMLFSPAGSMHIHRIQGAYISEEEVLSIVKELKKQSPPEYLEEILYGDSDEMINSEEDDPIFDQAVEIVLKTKRASASFLQRRLKIGYNRAARLIEMMEEKGIIGPPRGSKPREIYIDRVD